MCKLWEAGKSLCKFCGNICSNIHLGGSQILSEVQIAEKIHLTGILIVLKFILTQSVEICTFLMRPSPTGSAGFIRSLLGNVLPLADVAGARRKSERMASYISKRVCVAPGPGLLFSIYHPILLHFQWAPAPSTSGSAVSESRLSNPSPSPSHHLRVRGRVITSKSEFESSLPSPRVRVKFFFRVRVTNLVVHIFNICLSSKTWKQTTKCIKCQSKQHNTWKICKFRFTDLRNIVPFTYFCVTWHLWLDHSRLQYSP